MSTPTDSEHLLETPWSFWFDKRSSDKKVCQSYEDGLKKIGTCDSVEDFYRFYSHLTAPSELPVNVNIHLFRSEYKPMWEEFPDGGCWFLRIPRRNAANYLDATWEKLLLAIIGEQFDMPDVVGCVLSTRRHGDVISLWNKSNQNPDTRFKIGEKLREVLDLSVNSLIQYKQHVSSMRDFSSFSNAKHYVFAPSANEETYNGAEIVGQN